MTPSGCEAAGQRITRARRRRGLSQAVLAGLVGRSESWLSQVERGKRGVDSHSVLTRLAASPATPARRTTWAPRSARSMSPSPDGEIVTTRYTLRALLDKLDELLSADPGQTPGRA